MIDPAPNVLSTRRRAFAFNEHGFHDADEKEGIVSTRHITINHKGQITLPVEFRRVLEVSAGDQIAIERQGDAVILRRVVSTAARTAGIFAAYRRPEPLTADEERAAFADAVAASTES